MQAFLEIAAKYLGPAGVAAFLVGLAGWSILNRVLTRLEAMQQRYLEDLKRQQDREDQERDKRLADKDQAAADHRDLTERIIRALEGRSSR